MTTEIAVEELKTEDFISEKVKEIKDAVGDGIEDGRCPIGDVRRVRRCAQPLGKQALAFGQSGASVVVVAIRHATVIVVAIRHATSCAERPS